MIGTLSYPSINRLYWLWVTLPCLWFMTGFCINIDISSVEFYWQIRTDNSVTAGQSQSDTCQKPGPDYRWSLVTLINAPPQVSGLPAYSHCALHGPPTHWYAGHSLCYMLINPLHHRINDKPINFPLIHVLDDNYLW